MKFVEGLLDVAGHTEVACAIGIIPVELDATEAFAGPVDFNIFIMVAEALDEMVGMFFANVFDAKIVDDKAEGDQLPLVVPESGCVGNRGIAIATKETDMLFFGEDSCLGKATHTAVNFHVDFTFMYNVV